jgi:iron complex transport system permease protein
LSLQPDLMLLGTRTFAGLGGTERLLALPGVAATPALRLTIGPDHRWSLHGAALLGATLPLGADLIAGTLVTPAELSIGIVTALIGEPFFPWLLRARRVL